METTITQITDFLNKCEEVKNCKFIMATTRIKDLLKSIVNSAELYELFNTVAANFDYIAAKQKCFVDDAAYGHCRVVLPDTIGDRLAFIFCLLVEFDRNDINFNAFLQKYYPKDGSYYASYHLFCDEVIGSLESIVCEVFAQELGAEQGVQQLPGRKPAQIAYAQQQSEQTAQSAVREAPPVAPNPQSAALINMVCMLIESEKEGVCASSLKDDDKDAACMMLDSLADAVRSGDASLIKSLTCGYNYLVMNTVFVSESVSELFEAISEYLGTL